MDKIIYDDGELHIFKSDIRRPNFSRHHREIQTVADLKATIRAGQYTGLGGYQIVMFCSDGHELCFDCARNEFRQVAAAVRDNDRHSSWNVVGCDVIYEGKFHCAHCGKTVLGSYEDEETAE